MWHALVAWFQSGDYRPTLEGVGTLLEAFAALVAGLLAFFVVRRQIRSSSADMQKQLDAEKAARMEEAERHKKAVAAALVFEIDYIYRYFIRDVGQFLSSTDQGEPLLAKTFDAAPFPVYHGNTGDVGQFDEGLVGQIVHFYAMATNHVTTFRAYSEAVRNLLRLPQAGEVDAIDWENMSRQYRSHLEDPLPALRVVAYDVSADLCRVAGIKFESPNIAVAAEDRRALLQQVRGTE